MELSINLLDTFTSGSAFAEEVVGLESRRGHLSSKQSQRGHESTHYPHKEKVMKNKVNSSGQVVLRKIYLSVRHSPRNFFRRANMSLYYIIT